MPSRIRVFSTVLGFLLLVASLASSTAFAAPSIAGEFPLASGIESNNQLTTGPDNNVWVTLGGPVNDVAKITPAGKVEEFDLGINGAEGIAVQGEKIWVTASNTITSFKTSAPEATKSTTLINEINGTYPVVLGPDGRLWVATSGTTLALNPADPAEFDKFPKNGMAPRDIDVSGGNLVIADFGGSRILTVNVVKTATRQAGEYIAELGLGGGPQGVAGSPSGQFAFSQPSVEPKSVGVFSAPADLKTKELGKGADPFGVDLGPDGAYWFAYSKENEKGLLRLSTSGDLTELKGLKEGLPRQITEGPGNTLWVTMERPNETGFVAEVKGVEKTTTTTPPGTEPRTQLGKGPASVVRAKGRRATVSFRFSSPDPGTTFQCRLTKVAKHAKTPAFAACRSPKVLHLAPGSYRFEVRAVLGGVADKTPVKRSFKVVRKRAHRHR